MLVCVCVCVCVCVDQAQLGCERVGNTGSFPSGLMSKESCRFRADRSNMRKSCIDGMVV